MFNKIFSWFKKEPKLPKFTGYIYNSEFHKDWGNAINFDSKEEKPGEYSLSAHGHLTRKPENGDIIESKTQKGKIAQWLVFNIRYVSDPRDMWFCDLALHKYIEEFSERSRDKFSMFRT